MRIREKGTHTWDIFIRYHRCPQCGDIIESRRDYTYRQGQYVKDLTCGRCGHHFVETRHTRPNGDALD